VYNPLDLTGKTILVTGASSGIGRAIAIALSKLNARVVLSGQNDERLATTQADMSRSDVHIRSVFTFSDDCEGAVLWLKQVCMGSGPLDGIVHSAGVSQTVPLRVITRAHINAILHPNLHGALAILKAATSRKVLTDDSCIVLLSSVASIAGFAGLSTYAASKGALNALARSASLELGARRVRVNCVAPALTETPMVSFAREELPGDFSQNEKKQFLGLLEPEEIAISVAFLLSRGARHITGTTLVIDGGRAC
jgi:NAD(P)-dependent dehydrogenase (short-subunit alcohol dehydrogenase family)